MGLSGDGLHIKVLAAFSPVLNLSFPLGVLRDVGHRVVLGHILGPFKELLLCVPEDRAPRPGLWALNVKWAGIPIFRPHNSSSKSCFPTF